MALKSKRNKVLYGPWSGGMNNALHPANILDNEAYLIDNFDISDDGILYPRKPFKICKQTTDRYFILGDYTTNTAAAFLLKKSSSTVFSFAYWEDPSGVVDAALTGFDSTSSTWIDATEYGSKVFVINNTGSKSFWVNNGTTSGAVNLMPNVPTPFAGYKPTSLVFKDRLFLFSGYSRVYYSKVTDPTIWAAPDGGFFDVNASNSSRIIRALVVNDTLYIFKTDGVWAFNYTNDPSDGQLRLITKEQGILDACVYDNNIYVISSKGFKVGVYLFSGALFTNISLSVKLSNLTKFSNNARIKVFNRKLIININGDMFVMNLTTGAWSIYSPATFTVTTDDGMGNITTSTVSADVSIWDSIEVNNNLLFMNSYFDAGINASGANLFYMPGEFDTEDRLDTFYANEPLNSYISRLPVFKFWSKQFNITSRGDWKRFYYMTVDGIFNSLRGSAQLVNDLNEANYDNAIFQYIPLKDKILAKSMRFRSLVVALTSDSEGSRSTDFQVVNNGTELSLEPTLRQITMVVGVKAEVDA